MDRDVTDINSNRMSNRARNPFQGFGMCQGGEANSGMLPIDAFDKATWGVPKLVVLLVN